MRGSTADAVLFALREQAAGILDAMVQAQEAQGRAGIYELFTL